MQRGMVLELTCRRLGKWIQLDTEQALLLGLDNTSPDCMQRRQACCQWRRICKRHLSGSVPLPVHSTAPADMLEVGTNRAHCS